MQDEKETKAKDASAALSHALEACAKLQDASEVLRLPRTPDPAFLLADAIESLQFAIAAATRIASR